MDILTLLGLSVGLAMDAFAVSVASGAAIRNLRIRHALRLAFFFGLFQAGMPLLGWCAGLSMARFIAAFSHWVAFALLAGIGGKMLFEAHEIKREEEHADPVALTTVLMLAVATSIDALAVGITFAVLGTAPAVPVLVIGLVTAVLSFAGAYVGDRLGHVFENRIEIAGGLILVGIGLKILVGALL